MLLDMDMTEIEQVLSVLPEAYDSVVTLSCPYLPRDCQIEILQMLIRLPLPLIQRNAHQNQKGFIVKLLPEAKKVHRQFSCLSLDLIPGLLPPIEEELYELRKSFSIDFNFSYLGNIKSDCLLHFVAAFGTEENYEKFITLASLQADVDSQNLSLYIAFKYRNMNLVTYFLKDAVDQNLLSIMLGLATKFGYVSIVRDIMEECNKCHSAFEDNFSIQEAARRGHLHVEPAINDNEAIRNAATGGHLDVVKYLISLDSKYGIDPAATNNYAIRLAAYGGHLEVVKYLMSLDSKYGIDPAADVNYAIRLAASGGHLEVVKYLMSLDSKYGIDPTGICIGNAAYGGHLEVVKYLMSLDSKYGIDPAADVNYAIRLAASGGHLEVVKYLMSLDSKYWIDPAAYNNEASSQK